MKVVEALSRQNPKKWNTVTDGDGPFDGGLYCNLECTLVLKDVANNDISFTFQAGQFVPLEIKQVVSGATGNEVIGLRKV